MSKKAVIYARVSSKEQEIGGFSIPAQLKYLNEYAQKNGFEVVKIFTESMTAKESGRFEFDDMLKFLKKQKTPHHLLVEKKDRLLRNENDSAIIINLALKTDTTIHLAKDSMILNKNSNPHDFFIFTMLSAVSAMYPRNLSREVKKGMDEKAEEGFFPARAPVGYKNFRESKKKSVIIVDNTRAGFVIRAFELYSTGVFSYKQVAEKLTKEGFYPQNKPCTKKSVEKILINPFYMGEFDYNGKRYFDANHTPLISKELYYICQRIRESHSTPRKSSHDFLYSGMIKCSICGRTLVGDLKKGKYIYYRCTDHNKDDGFKALKSAMIDNAIDDLLKTIHVDKEVVIMVLDKLKEILNIQFEYESVSLEEIEKKIKQIRSRLNKLYIDKLDGVIEEDSFLEFKKSWQVELDQLECKLTLA